MADLIAHKAVELSKVRAARRKVLSAPGYLDQNYMAQPKHDGCFGAVVCDEHVLYSRTGEETRSMKHIVTEAQHCFPGQVVFGEVWAPGIGQSEISGAFRQHHPAEWLVFVVFDVVTLDQFNVGYSSVPYKERVLTVERGCSGPCLRSIQTYNAGTYGQHEILRDQYLAKGGYDGLILRDPEGCWQMGPGTGGEIVKSKRVLSFDLQVLGVVEGKGKMSGMAGALQLRWKDGRVIEAGGMDYDTRRSWLRSPETIVGKIVEVEAMDYSSDGLLREPRIKGIRFDKDKADF